MSNPAPKTSPEPKKLAKFYEIKSFTTKQVKYTVRHMPDDTWLCDCPRGVFAPTPASGLPCKHILLAQKMEAYPLDPVKWAIARAELLGKPKIDD